MGNERRTLRIGAAAIIGALALRLLAKGLPALAGMGQDAAAWLIFAESGRWPAQTVPTQSATVETVTEPTQPQKTAVVFSAQQAQDIALHNTSPLEPELASYLTMPLDWDLQNPSPRVLILHTHACESYADSGGYRSEDPSENMVAVGEAVKQRLEQAGIGVIHDTTLHDKESYNGSYDAARRTAQDWLAKYPDICLVLDLHRDAIEDASGNQLATQVRVNGKQSAQIMLVLGMGYSWEPNPSREKNLALGTKLYVQMERFAPGICRPICLRGYRYNQDLGPCSLLVEMGVAGNTLAQALEAGNVLADAIISLAAGSA